MSYMRTLEEETVTFREKFKRLNTKADVADLLDISVPELNAIYGRHGVSNYYKTFKVPKKNGESREIAAPVRSLKYIQNKLSKILVNLVLE